MPPRDIQARRLRSSWPLLLAAFAATALFGTLGPAVGVLAAPVAGEAEGPPTRWAVTPADESGRDQRSSLQHALDPGESITEHIAVHNLGDRDETFRLTAADGFTTPAGRFDMLADDEESTDAGTWIDIVDEVTVGAGESAIVPLTITVPEQAEPGDHPAGVAASVLRGRDPGEGTSLGVESRVGVKVTTRVTGELAPAVGVGAVSSRYEGSWNPLRPGRVITTFEVANEGNTRLSPAGEVAAGTGEAAFPAEGEQLGELLPGDAREITVVVDGVWPTFRLPGRLHVDPEVVVLDGTSAELEAVDVTFGTWAPPWPQLLVLLALAMLALALVGGRLRGRRRLEILLREAREEGRRSVAGNAPGDPSAAPPTGTQHGGRAAEEKG